jgi:DNA repair protein RadD
MSEVSVSLREYQSRSIERVRECVRRGDRRILLTVPTGGGKTLTSAAILASAVSKGSRVLFAAHRKELIDQTCTTFARLGVTSFGVIRAQDIRRDEKRPIQICSVQTLARRARVLDVKIVVIDEAHRAVSPSYRKHLFEAYPDAIFIGLTATPIRGDGKPLGIDWRALVVGARYSELIDGGHLAEPLIYSTPVLPDLSKVHTVAGEFDQKELEAAVNRGALIGSLYDQWAKLSAGRRTVVFAVSVAHSEAIVAMFRERGVRAEHLDGTTPEAERAQILARLESGATQIVSNVGVLCEGWDMPSCKCLLLARPTKSLGLYMQMAGRILRPWGGVAPLIIDHGANFDRHGAPHADREWSLSDKLKEKGETLTKLCPACFAYIARGLLACPHCGHSYSQEEVEAALRPPEPEIVPVDLQLRTCSGDDAKLAFFRATAKEAEGKGWKPIAITMRYRERFGERPPSEWTLTVRNAYAASPGWKKLDKEREPMRARLRAEKERALYEERDAAADVLEEVGT